jgi:CheY-like chemotaxis protein
MLQATEPHVLVVDDDECVRRMMTMVLEDAECDVLEAADGAKALAILCSSPVRLVVLLDWMMPGMNGQDVLRVVKADRTLATRHAYVLVTANAEALTPQFKDLLRELSVPVISKPFSIQGLIDTVDQQAPRICGEMTA